MPPDHSLADIRSRTLLVYPPVGVANGQSYLPFPPSGLAYLRGYLEERGHPLVDVCMPERRYPDRAIPHPIFGRPSEKSWSEFPSGIGCDEEDTSLRKILEYALQSELDTSNGYLAEVMELAVDPKTRVFGLSCGLPSQVYTSLALGRAAKKLNPNLFVVIGGPIVTENIEFFSKCSELTGAIDGIIVGWGEEPLARLIRCQEFGGKLEDVPNFYYSTPEGLVSSKTSWTPDRSCMLTTPVYENPNVRGGSWWRYVNVRPAIGCYWSKCSFCTYPAKYDRDVVAKIQLLDPGELVTYMRRLTERYQTNNVFLSVDALPPNYLRDVSEAIINAKLDIQWSAWVCVDRRLANAEVLGILKQSGFNSTLIGMESINERILRRMNKMQKAEEIPQVVQAFLDAGIHLDVTGIIGFPGETREEAMETVNYMLSIAPYTMPILYRYNLMSESPVANNLQKFGVASVDWSDKYFVQDGFAYRYEVSEGLSFEETRELVNTAGIEILKQMNCNIWASAGRALIGTSELDAIAKSPPLGRRMTADTDRD